MIENGSDEPIVVNAFIIKMLHPLKPSINSMKAIIKEFEDQNKMHEARFCSVFLEYLIGVHNLALETKSYLLYPGKAFPPNIITIDLMRNQILRCFTMQKAYNLYSEQGITVDYEQIRHKLKDLKNLFRAEQPDRTAISNVIVELVYVTIQAYNQLIDDLSLQPKDQVAEEEAKSEPISDTAVITTKMLDAFKLAINDLTVLGKDLIDQGRIHEAGVCFIFSGCMLGVHGLAIETRSYLAYLNKILLPEISTINLICFQFIRCSSMQEEYGLHFKQSITIDYEQILHELKTLKDLVRAEQLDPAAISDTIVELIQVTVQAYNQLIDLSLKSKDQVAEEEAKPER